MKAFEKYVPKRKLRVQEETEQDIKRKMKYQFRSYNKGESVEGRSERHSEQQSSRNNRRTTKLDLKSIFETL